MSMDKDSKGGIGRMPVICVCCRVFRISKVPGKFINMGNKKDDYKQFCQKFAAHMTCEDDWWGMLVGSPESVFWWKSF